MNLGFGPLKQLIPMMTSLFPISRSIFAGKRSNSLPRISAIFAAWLSHFLKRMLDKLEREAERGPASQSGDRYYTALTQLRKELDLPY
jgi:hypothetical protein